MTLIRMLVFAPETDQVRRQVAPGRHLRRRRCPDRAPSPKGQALASGKEDAPVPVDVATEEPAPPPVAAKRGAAQPPPDLYDVIERMQPSGVTRMVLDNCQLASHEDDRWQLVLAEEHDLLLRDDSRASVQKLVSEYMGRPKCTWRSCSVSPTRRPPAERRRRLDAARQRAAEQAVESDETVQSLLRVFGGRVGSIQPLDDREYRSP